ncbi:hypothetical protein [Streptomyces ochraceiscleroticus]|uniref:Uncharacterized protein n=1 Tax=Streptomyces ochraceiscleroticus TaxID=47761 RepID=A0ABW1MMS1_9ACTN|nr:hypothetical protein [Streptomyces ochraceiscleroticus]
MSHAQTVLTAAPVWLAATGVLALLVLALLAAYVVRLVVCKARAEDLPHVLTGMSQVLEAIAAMLPWSRPRDRADDTLPGPPAGQPVPPAVRSVHTVHSVTAVQQSGQLTD